MTHSSLIDWHAHLFPEELTEALRTRQTAPRLSESGGKVLIESRLGAGPLQTSPGLLSVPARIAELDEAGIDVQVLSVAGLMGVDSVDDESVFDLVDRANRGLSRIVKEHPARFKALASLPLRAPEAAADILEHAVKDLGLIGAILPVDAFVTLAAAEPFRVILERANTLGAHIFVHPGPLPGSKPAAAPQTALDKVRNSTSGIQGGLTEAAITLEFSSYLDGLDRLTIHVANLAGNLAYLAHRWKHTEERLDVAKPWDGRLRRIYVDTASLGPAAIAFAANIFGHDRLLFGTDAPIYKTREPAADARRLGLGFAELRAA
ncbi:MAG: amidohydrolase family protein [Caulobacterales bacterium]